jgi:KDO2-lipid IV(A) lauroyltransferase
VTTSKGSTTKQPRFRREERREVRYLLSIAIAEALSWLFWSIPTSLRYGLADALSALFHRSTHTYRDNVESNVRQVVGPGVSDDEVRSIARGIFRISGRNFMDLITMPRRSKRALLSAVVAETGSWETIDRALEERRGVIFVTGHVGCFDFIGQAFWAKGYKLTVVTGRTTSRFIFDGVTHLRASKGSKMVEPTPSGVRDVIRALRRGECAVILCDRDFFQNGREVVFFGRPTTLPPGIVRIARDTGAVVVPIFTRRGKRDHQLRVLDPFTIEKTSDLSADMDRGLAKVVSILEIGIRESVDQWAMFQRVWADVAPEPVRVFPVGSPLESELLERVASALPERPILPDRGTRIGRGAGKASEDSPPCRRTAEAEPEGEASSADVIGS